ncbi:MAG: hypothetical protein ABSF48_23560 [Thermodesulfobacteriota bacterium]
MTGRDSRSLAFALLGALLSLAGAAAGADGDAPRTIGYRQDSTGVFPPDCAPVTAWNEWDFRSQPAKENRVHIVWKTPLASYCNGGMIVAKGKLYQMVDRGGVAYAREIAPDFVGSRLVCMDPADG